MDQYASYTSTGIEWLGDIPIDWTCANLGSVAKQRKNLNKDGIVDNVLSLSYGNVRQRVMDNSGLLPESFNTYNIIEDGDVVLRLTDLQNDQRSLRVGLCHEKGIITAAYTTLAPQSIESRYLFYALAVFDYWKGFYGLAGGVRQSLTFDGIRNLRFPLPSKYEQQAIADYLDGKTAEIDALVADSEQEIALLQEYRKAVISEVVTKGLDPNVPMKDSGVEWIGEIPESWQVSRISWLGLCLNGDRGVNYPSGEDMLNEGIPFVATDALHGDEIDPTRCKYISLERYNLLGGVKLKLDDIAYCLRGSVGTCAVNTFASEGTVASSLMVIRPKSCNAKWLYYALVSELTSRQVDSFMNGTCAANLSAEGVSRFRIPLPSVEGQNVIAAYLDAKTAEIDFLIEAKQQMADKLREYRKSLISEVVTGKFKVPGVQ